MITLGKTNEIQGKDTWAVAKDFQRISLRSASPYSEIGAYSRGTSFAITRASPVYETQLRYVEQVWFETGTVNQAGDTWFLLILSEDREFTAKNTIYVERQKSGTTYWYNYAFNPGGRIAAEGNYRYVKIYQNSDVQNSLIQLGFLGNKF